MPPDSEAQKPRRYLIAAGCVHYDSEEFNPLPAVAEDLERIEQLFVSRGYQRVLPRLGEDPSSDEFRKGVTSWFAAPDRRPDDIVVLYYAGHGYQDNLGDHRICTSNSDSANPEDTTVLSESIGRWCFAGEGDRPNNVWMILDTCYAGQGGGDAAGLVASVKGKAIVSEESGFWVLASAMPLDEAGDGVFSRALVEVIDALGSDSAYGGVTQEFIRPDAIPENLNDWFKRNDVPQRADMDAAAVRRLFRFVPNADYLPGLAGLDFEEMERLYREDLTIHWEPKARGTELGTVSYFTGRTAALQELVSWLTAPDSDGRARVVTGGPGSGKSAVLGRLVTLADPSTRGSLEDAGELRNLDQNTIPPPGSVDLAIHARGRTLGEILARIAASAEVDLNPSRRADENARLLIRALAERDPSQPLRIVVDALDEAEDPASIARNLLRDLGALGSIRLIVAARESLLGPLGIPEREPGEQPPEQLVDLDAEPYFDRKDVVRYVQERLTATEGELLSSPYEDPDVIREVAEAVAEKTGRMFLLARVVSRRLVAADRPIDTTFKGWKRSLPTSLKQAFEDEFEDRFSARASSVRDLLEPLAYAEGSGLPHENVWASVVSGTSGRQYSNSDIRDLKELARFYIVEDQEAGTSVYRLFHEELARFLRDKARTREIQGAITRALVDNVPTLFGRKGNAWDRARPYIRTHLATHAAAAGLLESLVSDPLYLLTADPDRLLRALITAREGLAPDIVATYLAAFDRLRTGFTGEAASCLQLAAHRSGATDLARRVDELPMHLPWRTLWAMASKVSNHRVLPQPHRVISLCTAWLEGRQVIVLGCGDGTVRVLELATGAPVYKPLKAHVSYVSALAVGELAGRQVIVSGGFDGRVRVWELATGIPVAPLLAGQGHGIGAVSVCELDGRQLIVSGDFDGTVLVRDLVTGAPVGEPMKGHQSAVRAVAVCELEREQVIVSHDVGGTVQVRDLATGAPVGEPLKSHESEVKAVAVGELQGRQVIVSGGSDGTVRVWDLATGASVGEPMRGHQSAVSALAVCELEERQVIVSGDYGGTVRIWELATGLPIGEPLQGHESEVAEVAVGEIHGQQVIVSGGGDRTVRVWYLIPRVPGGEPLQGHEPEVTEVAVGELEGRQVIVSGGPDGRVRVWDLATGASVGEPMRGHQSAVSALAVCELEERQVIVSGDLEGTVRIRELATGVPIGEPLEGHESAVNAVAVGEIYGRQVIVSGGGDATVRVWSLATGAPVGEPLRGPAPRVHAVAVGELQGRQVIVCAGDLGIRVWELATRASVWELEDPNVFTAVAVCELDERQVIVSGDWRGTLRVWDLATGAAIGEPLRGHKSWVSAVVTGEIDEQAVIISCARTVRMWDGSAQLHPAIPLDGVVTGIAVVGPRKLVAAARHRLVALRLGS